MLAIFRTGVTCYDNANISSMVQPEEREGGRGGEDVEREPQDGGDLRNVRGQHLVSQSCDG